MKAASVGWFDETGARVVVDQVPPRWAARTLAAPATSWRSARGSTADGCGWSRWRRRRWFGVGRRRAGTQSWSPRAGPQPFDLTTDLAAVTGDATLAGAGVVAALDAARAASARRRALPPGALAAEPVVLVGHSQGGLHAASLAADDGFRREHRVTHVLTTGAPVGLVPVPDDVRVLSVEHADDPVPTLDLAPNPARPSWLTLRVGDGPPSTSPRHRLDGYERTVRAAAGAPLGTVPGLRAWEASAGSVLGRPVLGVSEVVVTRAARTPPGAGWQNRGP